MKRSWAGALVTSCLAHAAMLAVGAWLLARAFGTSGQSMEVTLIEAPPSGPLELPTMSGLGAAPADANAPRARPETETREAGSAPSRPRPDLGRAGRGGERDGARSLALADEVASVALDRDAFDGRPHSQVQRLQTARQRRSLDNRRATPNPMQLSFVATGAGSVHSRQPLGEGAPGSTLGTAEPSRAGGRLGAAPVEGGSAAEVAGGEPGSVEIPELGSSAAGRVPSLRARVIQARPLVARARAAVPAHTRARASDTVESEAQVASAVRSLIQAGGLGDGSVGEGGEAAPGELGRDGARSSGARARAGGAGVGVPGFSPDNGLGRYNDRLLSRIDWRDAFPTWATAEGRGGLARIRLTLDRAGNVSEVSVIRPSGIAEFDQNLISAIRRAAPYGTLPEAAGSLLNLHISFDAVNPAVGREGPGPGARRR